MLIYAEDKMQVFKDVSEGLRYVWFSDKFGIVNLIVKDIVK